jgi:hypothetical protein
MGCPVGGVNSGSMLGTMSVPARRLLGGTRLRHGDGFALRFVSADRSRSGPGAAQKKI